MPHVVVEMIVLQYIDFIGATSCSFNIHNTSSQHKLLLYKIRRSEPQLVTFYPKHGVVKPGEMHEVELNLVNEKVCKLNVLFSRIECILIVHLCVLR